MSSKRTLKIGDVITTVDAVDADLITDFNWTLLLSKGKYHLQRSQRIDHKQHTFYLHHEIMKRMNGPIPKNRVVGHRDNDTLNNVRSNLVLRTHTESNQTRSLNTSSKSGYKGVSADRGQWMARITVNGERQFLGTFSEKEDAAAAYNTAAKEHFGERARLNIIPGDEAQS
jgi:hypothetical protein